MSSEISSGVTPSLIATVPLDGSVSVNVPSLGMPKSLSKIAISIGVSIGVVTTSSTTSKATGSPTVMVMVAVSQLPIVSQTV